MPSVHHTDYSRVAAIAAEGTFAAKARIAAAATEELFEASHGPKHLGRTSCMRVTIAREASWKSKNLRRCGRPWLRTCQIAFALQEQKRRILFSHLVYTMLNYTVMRLRFERSSRSDTFLASRLSNSRASPCFLQSLWKPFPTNWCGI